LSKVIKFKWVQVEEKNLKVPKNSILFVCPTLAKMIFVTREIPGNYWRIFD